MNNEKKKIIIKDNIKNDNDNKFIVIEVKILDNDGNDLGSVDSYLPKDNKKVLLFGVISVEEDLRGIGLCQKIINYLLKLEICKEVVFVFLDAHTNEFGIACYFKSFAANNFTECYIFNTDININQLHNEIENITSKIKPVEILKLNEIKKDNSDKYFLPVNIKKVCKNYCINYKYLFVKNTSIDAAQNGGIRFMNRNTIKPKSIKPKSIKPKSKKYKKIIHTKQRLSVSKRKL